MDASTILYNAVVSWVDVEVVVVVDQVGRSDVVVKVRAKGRLQLHPTCIPPLWWRQGGRGETRPGCQASR